MLKLPSKDFKAFTTEMLPKTIMYSLGTNNTSKNLSQEIAIKEHFSSLDHKCPHKTHVVKEFVPTVFLCRGLHDSSPCSLSFPVLVMAQVTVLSMSSGCDMLPHKTLEAEGTAYYGVERKKTESKPSFLHYGLIFLYIDWDCGESVHSRNSQIVLNYKYSILLETC